MPDRQAEEAASPPTWKAMLVKWLGLLPALFAVAYTIQWLPIDPPLWGKLLLETTVLVPLLNYVISPAMKWLFEDWLYKGMESERRDVSVMD